jgi:hypothetical protein
MAIVPRGKFYVYTLIRPDGRIFYVGKGQGNRIYNHEWEARRGHKCHKCNVIRKIWESGDHIGKEVVYRTHDEQAAYDYERDMINEIGFQNLTNLVPGGNNSQRVFIDPGKSSWDMTESEYITFLKSVPQITAERYNEALTNWYRQWLDHYKQEWRVARRTSNNDQATDLLVKIRELFTKLDIDTDWPNR